MSPDDVRSQLRRQPFVPFRIRVTDGRSFDVFHPEMVLVGSRTVAVGIYDQPFSPNAFPERHEMVALLQVVSLDPLDQTA